MAAIAVLLGLVMGGTLSWAFLSRRARTHDRETAAQLERRIRTELAEEVGRAQVRDSILAALPDGVVLFAPNGRVAYINAAARRLLDRSPNRVDAIPIQDLREAVERAHEGTPAHVDAETGSPSRTLRALAQPVQPTGSVLVVLRDVTEAMRAARTRRDFVANASHELKTPAAVIQASAETVREAVRADPDAAERFARQLEREAERLSRVVSDLLDLSRLESGPPPTQAVRLDEVVREEAARSQEEASRKDLAFEADIRSAKVIGSAEDLGLMVRNLLDNAIRYTPEGGQIRVRLTNEGDEAVLRVSDTGVGIPTRDLDRVFERFYRVDRARSRDTGGTGLGLSIVRHIVENQGGRITVSSELGRGSTFEVVLPAAAGG